MQKTSTFTNSNPNPAPIGPTPLPNPNPSQPSGQIPTPVLDPAQVSAQSSSPASNFQFIDPTATQQPYTPAAGYQAAPLVAPPTAAPYDPGYAKAKKRNLIETIILVAACLIAVTFIGLFIWKYLEWDNIKTDVDGQIDAAVAMAVSENTTKLENEFLEREQYPYKTFSGPADYGSVSFEFPKTWNTYIALDAVNGGNFEAYLNPGEVQPVSQQTINALRVQILNQTFENTARTYDGLVQNSQLTVTTRAIGNTVANVYVGVLPSGLHGIVTIFKVRDKTVLLQTDAELFAEEYYRLLDTVTFVE